MRRTNGSLFVLVISLLLALVASGKALGSGVQSPGVALNAIPPSSAPANVPGYTRKLPPPAGSVKPVAPDPNYHPTTCNGSVVNVSQTSGQQAESFVVVNPTNTNNLVAFSNLPSNSIFRAYSMNGGTTWTRGTVATNVACCDA